MKLAKVKTAQLVPTRPFDFDLTFRKPDHFTSDDNYWVPGTRWQTWHWQGKQLGLRFRKAGSLENPRILVNVYSRGSLTDIFVDSLLSEVRFRYNLDMNLSPFYRKFERDRVFGPRVRRLRGMRPGHQSSLYEYLMIGIVLQNATVRRSIQMLRGLMESFGRRLHFDNKELLCFWKPGRLAKVPKSKLRSLKLGYRTRAIKEIDNQFARSQIDEAELRNKDRETRRKSLLGMYGIGPATLEYLMGDVFHDWDFLEHISPWEQKIYSKILFDHSQVKPVPVKRLIEEFGRFGKFKGLAMHYVWEDLWWRREKGEKFEWLERLIRT